MGFRLFRMGIEGKVAVANLALIGCALVVILLNGPGGTDVWYSAGGIAYLAVAVLGFPVGWISIIFASVHEPGPGLLFLGPIFLPLNAYVWGYTVAAIRRQTRARKARRMGAAEVPVSP